jgi:MYXO-CTERM domain-containing protein
MRAPLPLPLPLPLTLALTTLAAGCGEHGASGPLRVRETRAAVTVGEVAAGDCDTSELAPLDLQIIAQANCQSPGAYVPLPALPNVTILDGVYAFLEQPALDALVAAVNANPGTGMQVNSMLRTVAEQYVLHSWAGNSCGITLAAAPGQSNHESGLAMDIQQYDAWRPALEAQGFVWQGSADPWHFDYAGPGAVDHRGEDVLAFQVLWNANHPEDLIDADGIWGPQTEARLVQAPAEGFPVVPPCGGGDDAPDVWLASEISGASDTFADGSSQGVVDLFQGDRVEWVIEVENRGGAPATSVTVSLDGRSALEPSAFTVERAAPDAEPEPAGEGTFADGAAEVSLADLLPGEVAIVRVDARAGAYSVAAAEPVTARAFVRQVEGHYTAADWGASPENDGTQTFGGGTLELELAADVYSHVRWELDSDRLEGMSGLDALAAPADGVLEIPQAEGAFVMTPATGVEGSSSTRLRLRARRDAGGQGDAAVYVFSDTGVRPSDDEALPLRVPIDLPADGEMHEVILDAGAAPALAGSIARVAFVPFAGGSGSAAIDYLRITGAADPGDADGGSDVDAGASCSCRTAPHRSPSPASALIALAMVALVRRRRTPG